MSGEIVEILAVDPGFTQSAALRFDGVRPLAWEILPNDDLLHKLRAWWPGTMTAEPPGQHPLRALLVLEQIESFGMPVGREVFETVFWAGQFAEAWPGDWHLLTRRAVKLHLCRTNTATEAHVRQALLDRFGPGKGRAIGLKVAPGPLYGLKADAWSALALAVTAWDQRVTVGAAAATSRG